MPKSQEKSFLSAKQKSRVQEAASIYIPPPLRLQKEPVKTEDNSAKLNPQKQKKYSRESQRESVSAKIPTSKKCENSYMLFDLAKNCNSPSNQTAKCNYNLCNDKNNRVDTNCIKSNLCSSKLTSQMQAKMCDNSYLLFSDTSSAKETHANSVNKKKNLPKHTARKQTTVESENIKKTNSNSIKINDFSGKDSLLTVKEKQIFDSKILGISNNENHSSIEDLSSQLGAVSATDDSFSSLHIDKSSNSVNCSALHITSSQKKCDNSSFLFYEHSQDCDIFSLKKENRVLQSNTVLRSDITEETADINSTFEEKHPGTKDLTQDNTFYSNNRVPSSRESTEDSLKNPMNHKRADQLSVPNTDVFDSIEDFVLEIYDFPVAFKTQDLISTFSSFSPDGLYIKWIDDTHALGVFSNPFVAIEVVKKTYSFLKVRHLQNSPSATQQIASTIPIPTASRPRTCPSLARRLVSGALGLRVAVSDEVKQAEKKMLQDAKAERRLAAKQREEAWEGTLKSNLDPN